MHLTPTLLTRVQRHACISTTTTTAPDVPPQTEATPNPKPRKHQTTCPHPLHPVGRFPYACFLPFHCHFSAVCNPSTFLQSSPILEYIPDYITGLLGHLDAPLYCPDGVAIVGGTRGHKT